MTFSPLTPKGLSTKVGSMFEFQLGKNFLEDFLNVHEEKKYRLLAAIKDLLNRFTYDIQQMDTENKTKLVNFLLKNHERFVSDLLMDETIMSKMDAIVYDIVKEHEGTSGGASTSSSFQANTVKSAILDICNATILIATTKGGVRKKILNDLPEVTRQPGEINIEKQTEKIIEGIRSKMSSSASLSADFSPSDIPVFIPKKLFVKTRQNSLKAKSIITQLIGMSTVTVQLSDKLIRERSITTSKIKGIIGNIKAFFSDRILTGGGTAFHIPSIFALNFPILYSLGEGIGKFTGLMKKIFNSKTSGFIFGGGAFVLSLAITGLLKISNKAFWKNLYGNFVSWMKGYTSQLFKYVGKQMLFNAIPIFNGKKIGNSFQSMSKVLGKYGTKGLFKSFALFPQMTLLKKVIGGYFKFIFKTFSFIYNTAVKLIRKTAKIVSNPLKRLIRFTFRLLKMPWIFILLGTVLGKIMSSAIDIFFTGDFDKRLEREVTNDMPELKKLGSSGIFSYVQKELDTISDALEAVNDVMNLKMPDTEKKGLENLGYSSETTEEDARRKENSSHIYDFIFNAASFVINWLLPKGNNPPYLISTLKTYMNVAAEKFGINKLIKKYRFALAKENQSNHLKDLIGHSIWELMENDAIGHAADSVWNFVSVFAGKAAGKQTGALAFKAGIHLPFAPTWLKIITAIGGHTLASTLTEGAVQGYLNSDLNLDQTETSQLTRLQLTYSHKYTTNRERSQMNLMHKNLTAGYQKASMFGNTLKRLGSVHSENRGLLEEALKRGAEAEGRLQSAFGSLKTGNYYSANETDTKAAKFNQFIEDKLVPIMEKDKSEVLNSLKDIHRKYVWNANNNSYDVQYVSSHDEEKKLDIPKVSNLYSSISQDSNNNYMINQSKVGSLMFLYQNYVTDTWGNKYKFEDLEPYALWGQKMYNSYILYALINQFQRGRLDVDSFIELYNMLMQSDQVNDKNKDKSERLFASFTKPFFNQFLENAIAKTQYGLGKTNLSYFTNLFEKDKFWKNVWINAENKQFTVKDIFSDEPDFNSIEEASNEITQMIFDGDNGLTQGLLGLNLNDYQIKDLKSSANQFFRNVLLADPNQKAELEKNASNLKNYFYAMAIDQYFTTQDNPLFKDLQKELSIFSDDEGPINGLKESWREVLQTIQKTRTTLSTEHEKIFNEATANLSALNEDQINIEKSANDIIADLSAINAELIKFNGVSSGESQPDSIATDAAKDAGGLVPS